MAMIWSHFSTGNSSIGETNWMPALLTNMSTLPNCFCASAIMAAISGPLAHIGAGIDRLDPEILFDAAALLFDRVLVAKAIDHDMGAVAGKGAGKGQADARGRAGDEGDFAFEHGGYPEIAAPACHKQAFSRRVKDAVNNKNGEN